MIRTQVFQLEPTLAQVTRFRREAGLARKAWKWALRYRQLHYRIFGKRTGYKSVSPYTLAKRWVRLKGRSEQVPTWVQELSSYTPRTAFADWSGSTD